MGALPGQFLGNYGSDQDETNTGVWRIDGARVMSVVWWVARDTCNTYGASV